MFSLLKDSQEPITAREPGLAYPSVLFVPKRISKVQPVAGTGGSCVCKLLDLPDQRLRTLSEATQ